MRSTRPCAEEKRRAMPLYALPPNLATRGFYSATGCYKQDGRGVLATLDPPYTTPRQEALHERQYTAGVRQGQ